MNPTAPLHLGDRPARLPIREPIRAVVRICWSRRRSGSRKWRRDGTRRRGRPCRRRSGGRRGRRRGEWRGRDRRCRLRQSRSRATPPNGHAAIVLLRLRPSHLDHVVSPTPIEPRVHPELRVHPTLETEPAIVWLRRRRARQEPAEQGDEQKKTEKAATRDDAGEISPGSNDVEISSETHVFVRGLLDVVALSSSHIRQSAVAAASTSNTTCCAILPSTYSAGTSTTTLELDH